MSKQKRILAKSALVLKVALILVLPLSLTPWFLIVSQTNAFKLATSTQPERFTELAFANPLDLPAAPPVGSKLPVKFIIVNKEGRDITYTYQLRVIEQGGTITTYGGREVFIGAGQTREVQEQIVTPSDAGRSEVKVELINKGQAIHFWLEGSTS